MLHGILISIAILSVYNDKKDRIPILTKGAKAMKTERLEPLLAALEEYRIKIKNNELLYYNREADQADIERYYKQFNIHMPSTPEKFRQLHALVKKSHKNKIPYFISKDEYLYTWVDLQPNGIVKNLYSGEELHPAELVKRDLEVQKRHDEYQAKQSVRNPAEAIPVDLKFNAEHIVPQSWFAGREPMKGDLHHLFACDPHCNAVRSNFAYYDFEFYKPESADEKIQNHCGVSSVQFFEPEYGKGTVARSMLYFILRYPDGIEKYYRRKINFRLMRKWNEQFPPTIYEKHRNQAIFEIQGNRNPFIDFPELVDGLYFPM